VDFQLLQLLFGILPDSNRLSSRHITEIANSSLKTLPRPGRRGLGQRDVKTETFWDSEALSTENFAKSQLRLRKAF
jgi:hypothetical protein